MEASTSSTIEPESMYGYINNLLMNPTALIILVIVVLIYIIVFVSLGDSSNTTSSVSTVGTSGSSGLDKTSGIIIAVIVGIFVILLLFNVLQYFFSIDIMASIKNLFNPINPQLDITVNQNTGSGANSGIDSSSELLNRPQVFNIPGNYYGYEDAKTLCQAYDSRLATYNEVEDAYNKGGEWCNYGWSEGQMALFPTQKTTFDNLQSIPGHEHDCGRPGINGGYIDNPNVRFGVNCYGYKPKITPEEAQSMMTTPLYPKTNAEIEFDKKVDYWRTKIHDIIVAPFNHNNWSVI
jgi:hypothetical protein